MFNLVINHYLYNLQSSSALPICGECLGTAAKNRLGKEEPLSSCAECGASIHLSCSPGGYGNEFAVQLKKGGHWVCEECSTCKGCGRPNDQTCLLCCSVCSAPYHWSCLDPMPDRRPKRPWRCRHCIHNQLRSNSKSKKVKAAESVKEKYSKVRGGNRNQR